MVGTRRSSVGGSAKAAAVPFYAALSRPDLVCFAWFVLDAFTHFVIEGSYLALALGETAKKSKSPFAMIWREYGKADLRWAVRDPNIISLEALTVLGAGPAAALCAYTIVKKAPWRHPLQALLSLAELYGGACGLDDLRPGVGRQEPQPGALPAARPLRRRASSPRDRPAAALPRANARFSRSDMVQVTSNPLYLWVYLFFMNFVWVIIPGILLVDSWRLIVAACDKAKVGTTKKGSSAIPEAWYTVVLGTLALYGVLVPLIVGLVALGKL